MNRITHIIVGDHDPEPRAYTSMRARSPAEQHPDILRELRAAFEQSGGSHPTFISDTLYERARANGFDMRGYITSAPVPQTSSPDARQPMA